MEKLKCKVVTLHYSRQEYIPSESGNGYFGVSFPQHIYFISNRKIKEGDHIHFNVGCAAGIRQVDKEDCNDDCCFKIEATTDPSLNLPLIPQSFIEKYVEKQGKIDEVMIDINETFTQCSVHQTVV
jgi:hypothetical protein